MTHPNVEELQRKRGDGAVGTGNEVALFTPALPQTRGRRCHVTTAAVSLGDRTFLALLAFGDPEGHCRRTGAEAPQHSAHGLHRSREGLPPERTGTQPAGDPHLRSERLGGGGGRRGRLPRPWPGPSGAPGSAPSPSRTACCFQPGTWSRPRRGCHWSRLTEKPEQGDVSKAVQAAGAAVCHAVSADGRKSRQGKWKQTKCPTGLQALGVTQKTPGPWTVRAETMGGGRQ